MRARTAVALVALSLLTSSLSCRKEAVRGRSGGGGFLDVVPADTPYVMASLEPFPGETMERMTRPFIGLFDAASSMRAAGGVSAEDEAMLDVMAELKQLMTVEGLQAAGLPRDLRAAVYGHGVWPVWRMELADAAKFEAFVTRFLEKTGVRHIVGELGGRRTWRFELEAYALTLTIDPAHGHAVAAFLPAGAPEGQLRGALGFDPQDTSVADTGVLSKIAGDRGWKGIGVGYVDLRRLARVGSDQMGADEVCRAELAELAEAMPRVLLGYTGLDEKEMTVEMVVELRKDLRDQLAAVQTDAGLGDGPAPGALFELAAAADVTRALSFVAARARAVAQDPYQCDLLTSLNELSSLSILDAPSFFGELQGVRAVLETFDVSTRDVQAWMIVRAREPVAFMQGFASALGMDLSALTDDGQPVVMPLGGFIPDANVAAKGDTAVIAIGRTATRRIPELLELRSSGRSPLLLFSYDYGRFMGELGRGTMGPMGPAEPMFDSLSRFGRSTFRVNVEKDGVSIVTSMELR
jgi:hypothetical protein